MDNPKLLLFLLHRRLMSMRLIDIVAMSSVSFLSALDFKSFFIYTDESEFSHEKKKNLILTTAWLYKVLFLVLFILQKFLSSTRSLIYDSKEINLDTLKRRNCHC